MLAAALLFTLAYSAFVLAANPSAVSRIITEQNASTINVTSSFATNQLFGYWKLDGNANGSSSYGNDRTLEAAL